MLTGGKSQAHVTCTMDGINVQLSLRHIFCSPSFGLQGPHSTASQKIQLLPPFMLASSYKGHEQEQGVSQDRLVGPGTHHQCGVGSPWLSFQGVLRHSWAGRLCFRPSSSSEPLSWGRVRAEASGLITALCLAGGCPVQTQRSSSFFAGAGS